MIYSFYIYTRNGSCLYQEKWNAGASKAMTYSDPEEEKRLLFGLLFSLKEFVIKIAPTSTGAMLPGGGMANGDLAGATDAALNAPREGLQRFQTNSYTCHQYESPSGLRFVLMTDNHAGDLSAVLKHIYSHIYVEYVVNNPLSDIKSAKPITSQLFRMQLKQYIEGIQCFR